jgi:hypothetical protein
MRAATALRCMRAATEAPAVTHAARLTCAATAAMRVASGSDGPEPDRSPQRLCASHVSLPALVHRV